MSRSGGCGGGGRRVGALLAWFRAALHWSAAEVPEALGWRVTTAVLGRRPDEGADVTEAVSSALADRLLEAAEALRPGLLLETEAEGPTFVRPSVLGGSAALECIVGERGWSVVRAKGEVRPAPSGPAARRLRNMLGGFLRSREGNGDASRPGMLVVDDRLGREVATTPLELLETAVRLAVSGLRYEGVNFELTQAARRSLERTSRITVSPAVERLLRRGGEVVATFRRYLRPRVLSEGEARLLERIGHETTTDELWKRAGTSEPFSSLLKALRAMESGRLVEIRLSERASLQDGLLPMLERAGQQSLRALL